MLSCDWSHFLFGVICCLDILYFWFFQTLGRLSTFCSLPMLNNSSHALGQGRVWRGSSETPPTTPLPPFGQKYLILMRILAKLELLKFPETNSVWEILYPACGGARSSTCTGIFSASPSYLFFQWIFCKLVPPCCYCCNRVWNKSLLLVTKIFRVITYMLQILFLEYNKSVAE